MKKNDSNILVGKLHKNSDDINLRINKFESHSKIVGYDFNEETGLYEINEEEAKVLKENIKKWEQKMKLQMKQRKFKEKLNKFAELCGNWDYRDLDRNSPQLSSIEIYDKFIEINCELYSDKLDEYVSCCAGIYLQPNLVNEFKKLNLNDKSEVISFMGSIEDLVDWDKVYKILEANENYELAQAGLDEYSIDDDRNEYENQL